MPGENYRNQPSRNKSILGLLDIGRENKLDSIGQSLRDNFVDDIAQTDWPEVSRRCWRKNFWDEGNVGIIDLLKHMSRIEKRKHCIVTEEPTISQYF